MNNRRSFIVGIKSLKLSSREKLFLRKYKPWGVILFTRNIKNIKQTLKLTTSIRKIFKDKKYPILIDQEGGRVNRLKNIISFDNLTSEYFGRKFVKNYKEFNIYYKLFVDKTSVPSLSIREFPGSTTSASSTPCIPRTAFLYPKDVPIFDPEKTERIVKKEK